MLQHRLTPRRLLARLVLVGLVLRVAVPVGFMPSNLDDGWFLKLSPDGMPMSVMMALLGHHHQHHGEEAQTYQQCDLGGALADETTASNSQQLIAACLNLSPHHPLAPRVALSAIATAFQARAPPFSQQLQST